MSRAHAPASGPSGSPGSALTPATRTSLARLIAAALAADLRENPTVPEPSVGKRPGAHRSLAVVGRLDAPQEAA